MKNHKILCFLSFFFLSLMSCEKFLDVRSDSKLVKVSTVADVQAVLDAYTVMNMGYPSDGEASADNYFLLDDNYNALAPEEKNIYSWAGNSQRPTSNSQWFNSYRVVYYANLALQVLDNLKDNTDVLQHNTLRGSALFFRAFSFFNLAQLYADPYTTVNLSKPGIPLRLSPDIDYDSDRGTVQQVYDRITQDLKESVSLLPYTSGIKSRPNKIAAFAALARVYLSMRNYDQAGIYADSCLKKYSTLMNYNAISTTSTTPFARFNGEVIFQSLLTPGVTISPNSAKVNLNLYNSYDANDLRKKIFFKASGTDFRFTGNYEPVTTAAFFNGLATDEMYLIRAECYARNGKLPEALADLNTLMKTRWLAGNVNFIASNADEALKLILAERRKELIFRGLRWSDLRRLNPDPNQAITLSRSAVVNGQTQVFSLPANDLRYTLLIPLDVMNRTRLIQNPR
ncbi:RagB/SusD family nutrient uptake outer membrane protein [Pedobacter sp. PLR]|uniref:RagB/SusD family nutrient uptake outer membrane protein n=1 Tax=Pedobacter sp. PLR TaxID=2994465 RepID=UPI002246F20A|nr:RagB/SusD family nutrient uptake outer membrane protein [Pedobacter sp. PLR]MCX2450323.1 RagB/SusD family nutrient uptake outer membrane protein [Pedobacter sp. PLR]